MGKKKGKKKSGTTTTEKLIIATAILNLLNALIELIKTAISK